MSRVCFVSPLARPILEPGFDCDFGGAEVRAVQFATGLAAHDDYQVSLLLRSYRREQSRQFGRLTAYFEPTEAPIQRSRDLPRDCFLAWNLLKLHTQKLLRSWRRRHTGDQLPAPPIEQIDADIFCCFGVHQYAADVIKMVHALGKQALLFIAHDSDLDVQTHQGIVETYGGNQDLHRQVIASADALITQTPHQQQLLQELHGRTGHLIRNPIDLQADQVPRTAAGEYILWVGRADTFFKRADTLMELARRCADVPFVAIMNKRNPAVFDQLVAAKPANVQLVTQVPFQQVETYYANAVALLSTSVGEGFPNAFLQAGKYGRPILSLHVDPGEMLSNHRCGLITHGQLDAMADAISQVWQERASASVRQLSENIASYVQHYHRADQRVAELQKVLATLTQNSQSKAA